MATAKQPPEEAPTPDEEPVLVENVPTEVRPTDETTVAPNDQPMPEPSDEDPNTYPKPGDRTGAGGPMT